MSKSDVSYFRSIAKSNVLFGGVQIFNIIISIVRSKFVAVLLGPMGMGIAGLFNSTIDLIRAMSNLGLQTSAVRDVSLACKENNPEQISQIYKVLARLVWLTGLLGALIMILFAPLLSEYSFSSNDYTNHIRILAVVIVLQQLTSGKNVFLQGLRKLKQLASANILGSISGLVVTLPLYYFWGLDGIVPALIINALIIYLIARYFTYKINIKKTATSWKDTFIKGRNMIKMGFLISLTGLMDMAVIYIIKNYIQSHSSIAEVGLYTAGFAVVQSYVGLIFNSISTDYYPRLIAASMHKNETQEIINKQFELMILILTPLVLIFIIFGKIILYILYTSEFMNINIMIGWIAFGMLVRAYSWCPGYLYLAKNDSTLYFIIYIFTIIFQLSIYIGLYNIYGLTGIGIAFVLLYIISSIITVIIIKKRYGITYSSTSNKLLIGLSTLTLFTLLLTYIENWYIYILQSVILLSVCYYCYMQLNKRLDISTYIRRIKK